MHYVYELRPKLIFHTNLSCLEKLVFNNQSHIRVVISKKQIKKKSQKHLKALSI